jgi:Zn-dependent peptidase ImmA (M78 family)
MFINQNEPRLRQRFSLLHEFKHVLDFPNADILHAKLGCGNQEMQGTLVEAIANEFAGQVLMPKMLVKREWFRYQDIRTLATIFNVSMEAMATRLEKLNLIGEPRPAPRGYFRTVGLVYDREPSTITYAA